LSSLSQGNENNKEKKNSALVKRFSQNGNVMMSWAKENNHPALVCAGR
jgi:hypothetical protein